MAQSRVSQRAVPVAACVWTSPLRLLLPTWCYDISCCLAPQLLLWQASQEKGQLPPPAFPPNAVSEVEACLARLTAQDRPASAQDIAAVAQGLQQALQQVRRRFRVIVLPCLGEEAAALHPPHALPQRVAGCRACADPSLAARSANSQTLLIIGRISGVIGGVKRKRPLPWAHTDGGMPVTLWPEAAAVDMQGRTPLECVLAGLETSFMDCAVLQTPGAAPWDPEVLQEVCLGLLGGLAVSGGLQPMQLAARG